MPLDLTTLRHEQLFELLRQQCLSEGTNARLRARSFARAEMDIDEATKLKSLAVNSWQSA